MWYEGVALIGAPQRSVQWQFIYRSITDLKSLFLLYLTDTRLWHVTLYMLLRILVAFYDHMQDRI
jgi:hypothetical protein